MSPPCRPEETRRQVPNEVIKELVVKEVPVEAVETMPDPTLVEQDERYEETKGSPAAAPAAKSAARLAKGVGPSPRSRKAAMAKLGRSGQAHRALGLE